MNTKMNHLQTTLGILLFTSLLIACSAAAAPVVQSTPSEQLTPADQFPLTTIPVTVGQLGTTPITGIIVTGTGLGNIVVTAAVASGPGTDTGVPLIPGTVYTYVDISPVQYKTITGALISFVVPQSWLDEHHIAPQDIIIYHRAGSDWQPLPTTLVLVTNGQANYTASSPAFFLFAITGQTPRSETATVSTPVAAPSGSGQIVSSTPATSALPAAGESLTLQTIAVPAPEPAGGIPLATLGIVGIVLVVLGGIILLVKRR